MTHQPSSSETADLIEKIIDENADVICFRDGVTEITNTADLARQILAAIGHPAQPSLTITDEMLNAHIKALGNWAAPFTAERESGVAIDSDISQEDADFFNDEERKRLRIGYAAALSLASAERRCGFCDGPLPCLTHNQALSSVDRLPSGLRRCPVDGHACDCMQLCTVPSTTA